MTDRELQSTTNPELNPADNLLGYAEAAAQLGVAIGTLYAWVCQKRVPHYRISSRCVRFSRAELTRWIASRAVDLAGTKAP